MARFLVSVIVVNYNCYATLKECIESILSSKNVDELILIDNASKDASMDLVKEFASDKRLKFINLPRNIGLGGARNLAALSAKNDYIAFTDADTVVDVDWLQEPCSNLQIDKTVGAIQCRILSWKLLPENKAKGIKVDKTDLETMPDMDSSYELLYPNGVAFVIKREAWNCIRGFDQTFFVGNEDVDLGVRLWLSGYRVICSKNGFVYHYGGTLRSRKDINAIFKFYAHKNILTIWIKNLEGKTLTTYFVPFILVYPVIVFFDGGIWGIKGLISFLKNFSAVLIKRKKVQVIRKISDKRIIPMMHRTGTLPIQLFTYDFKVIYKYIFKRIKAIA